MHQNQSIQVAVGVVMKQQLDEDGWQVLISQRSDKQVLGGLWEFPGGKLEPGESAEACVTRELREELGITVRPTAKIDPIEHRYDHAHVFIQPFYCEHIGDEQPQAVEVADWKWIAVDDLGEVTFPPANAPLITQIKRDYGR
ncbi:MAG: 8-oxo-dGTP diphosphatase MutT [Planctomycetota bacterium]